MNHIRYIINSIIAIIALGELWRGLKHVKRFLVNAQYGVEIGVLTAFYVIMVVITLVMISFIVQNVLRFIVGLKYGGQDTDSVRLVRIADKIQELLTSFYQFLFGLIFGALGAFGMFVPGIERNGPVIYVVSGIFLVFALFTVIRSVRNMICILKNGS